MKVLHVETGKHLYGGARQVLFLLNGLHTRGVDNVLCCPRGSAIQNAANKDGVPVCTTTSAGDLDFRFFLQLRKILQNEKPDLVHLHSRRGADVLGGVAAKLEGIPTVVSRRVDNPEPRFVTNLKYRLYDHIITISYGIRAVLLSQGVPEHRISCVHSAVDASFYQQPADRNEFIRTFNLPSDAVTLAVIAQLIPRKGHRYLLQCLPTIIRDFPRVHVLFFGQGPLEQALRTQIAAENLQGRVQLAGFRNDLHRWLGRLDIVVHPADMEGLGVSLLQAAAAGVPIIASRAGGIPEIVHHQVNGFLIDPGDSGALETDLRQLLADTESRHRMGLAGRTLVNRDFSIDTMVDGNLTVYHTVLEQNR